MRSSKLVGNGLLTFCPEIPGMDVLFGDDELVYFTDLDDLLEKTLQYHINERECRAIAERGWQRAHGQYNNTRVTAYMLKVLCGNPFSSDYEWQNMIFPSSSLQNNYRLQQNPQTFLCGCWIGKKFKKPEEDIPGAS